MGCFTGCFGLSSNTKRRNSTRKILPRHQRICSYEPLLSSDPSDSITNSDSPEKISSSNLRCEVEAEEKKEGTKKTRKRVRFNLNVQTFEPTLPSKYENYCSDDDEEAKGEMKKPQDPSSRSVYPANYRYHNCLDSLEDEDEMGNGESDLEDEDYYTDDENDYEDDADDQEDENQDATPLLNPVENITQWKAVKAKPVRVKQLMKENVEADSDDQARPLLKEIIVNTSLADWLASPKTFHENGSTKRSPIVDITNMENRSKVS